MDGSSARILARALLDCTDAKCSLCATCLAQIRAVLDLSDHGWPNTGGGHSVTPWDDPIRETRPPRTSRRAA